MSDVPVPRDLETREDVETLVRAFYEQAFADPVIGFFFTDVAQVDLEEHLPHVTSFWATLLLDEKSYERGAFHPHAALHARAALRPGHFERWLALFYASVDAHFAGPRSELAKATAYRLAGAFERRLAAHPSPADAASEGLVVTRHGGARG